jgi:hypothetical protein|tara:strand:- start:1296 stop:2156 length:861 start_codon:yes stop_codon:yes gene_type:complete
VRYILINDFFSEDLAGGGHAGGAALNDEILIDIFKANGQEIVKLKSPDVTSDFLKKEKDSFFIISNFFRFSSIEMLKEFEELKYIIYAHDYKFVNHMNPARYDNFIVPENELICVDFFRAAKSVICQSSLQQKIYDKNLKDNVKTLNFSGNLWSLEALAVMRDLSDGDKKPMSSVVKSHYAEKGTPEAIKFCIDNKMDYELIFDADYESFLRKISKNQSLVFWPKTPETCGRMVLEAKMMNVKVAFNNLLGASHEPWFNKDGEELIAEMTNKRQEIYDIISAIATR